MNFIKQRALRKVYKNCHFKNYLLKVSLQQFTIEIYINSKLRMFMWNKVLQLKLSREGSIILKTYTFYE